MLHLQFRAPLHVVGHDFGHLQVALNCRCVQQGHLKPMVYRGAPGSREREEEEEEEEEEDVFFMFNDARVRFPSRVFMFHLVQNKSSLICER